MIQDVRHKFKTSFTGLLSLVWIVIAVIPSFFIVTTQTASASDSNKILICTSTGYKYISIEKLSRNESDEQNTPKQHCPLCIIQTNNFEPSLSSTALIEFSQFLFSTVYLHNNDTVKIQNERKYHHSVRAPPYFLNA